MAAVKVADMKPETVVWERDPVLEQSLQRFGVNWRWEPAVPLDKISYDRNPSRLREKLDQTRVDDLSYKIMEHGMPLPGLLLFESGGKLNCGGGFHRSASCKIVGIKAAAAYVVTGIGPTTAFELSIVNNSSNVGGLSVEERVERAAEEVRRLEGVGTPADIEQMAVRLDIPADKLLRKVAVGRFRAVMTQPDTFVAGSDKMSDTVVDVLARGLKTVNEPILIEAARCLARFKDATGKMAEEMLREVKKVTPKTEASQRAKIAEIEQELRQKVELSKADGKTKAKREASTAAGLLLTNMTRLSNSAKVFDTANLLDLFQAEQRDEFLAIANTLLDQFRKAVKVIKEVK